MFEGGGRSPAEPRVSRCVRHKNTSRKSSGCGGSVLQRRVTRHSFGVAYETRVWLCDRHYRQDPGHPDA